jgi:hypothetical protein
MLDANYTLSNYNGVTDESRNAVLVATGTNSAIRQIVCPLVEKLYIIYNNTTGGYAITIGGATGSAVTIPNGVTAQVYCDGVNFFSSQTGSAGNFNINGNLTVAGASTLSGATTLSSALTYGGVALSNSVTGTGSMVLSTSPALTGTPTAPTASLGTNTTQLATTAFVIANAPTPPVIIPAGSVMLFYQAAAPTGWTQVTTAGLNDSALRIVTSTGGTTSGTSAFSTVFTNQTPSFTGSNGTLSVSAGTLGTANATQGGTVSLSGGGSINGATLSTGQLASHNHTVSINTGGDGGSPFQSTGNDSGTATFTTSSTGSNESHSHGFNNPSYSFAGDAHSHTVSGSPSLSGTISGSNGAITLNVRYANIIICSKN